MYLSDRHGERERRGETAEDILHQVPDVGAREGVPLQPILDQAASDRDRARPLPHGAADQDLVPESADEVEKGAQDGEHEHCTVPHVALRPPLPVRAPPRPVRTLDVRRAELLKRLSSLLPLSAGLGHRHDSYVTGRLAR